VAAAYGPLGICCHGFFRARVKHAIPPGIHELPVIGVDQQHGVFRRVGKWRLLFWSSCPEPHL
jgi:hypothetical protein